MVVVAVLAAVADGTAAVAEGTRAPSILDSGIPASAVIPSHITPSSHITAISFRTAISRSSDTAISSVSVSMPALRAGLGCLRGSVGDESGYAIIEDVPESCRTNRSAQQINFDGGQICA